MSLRIPASLTHSEGIIFRSQTWQPGIIVTRSVDSQHDGPHQAWSRSPTTSLPSSAYEITICYSRNNSAVASSNGKSVVRS